MLYLSSLQGAVLVWEDQHMQKNFREAQASGTSSGWASELHEQRDS